MKLNISVLPHGHSGMEYSPPRSGKIEKAGLLLHKQKGQK